MADRGPLPSDLIRKRSEAEISRLKHMVTSQELEIMELGVRQQTLQENIDASYEAIIAEEQKLANLGVEES